MTRIRTGLEEFVTSPPEWITGKRLGLLCNVASVDRRFQHARTLIDARLPGQLKALFSPQHGFFAEKQDNMIESAHIPDPILGIPVFSLYGETRRPTDAMLDGIDVLLVDLQDVGTRVYTFASTLTYCMEAARRLDKRILVLDRPNPVNGSTVEGNCLRPEYTSFVGRYPIPMRHGLTIGELARLVNDAFGIGTDLDVIPMTGWRRGMFFQDTGLPWIPPSPNLPTLASALVYPGQVIWEGTNISEGRGTTQPFELFGAPFIDTRSVEARLDSERMPGALLREVVFEPTANKWHGELCRGFHIHVTDPKRYRPYATSLRLLRILRHLYPDRFRWKAPPYEYEYDRMPIDLILGDMDIRRQIEAFVPIETLEKSWEPGLAEYRNLSRRFHLYG